MAEKKAYIYKVYNPHTKKYMTATECGQSNSNHKKHWKNILGPRLAIEEYLNPRNYRFNAGTNPPLEIHKFEIKEHFVKIVVDVPKTK